MEQSRQNTWTMKHPALAKAYAVLFAVMSLILLLAGISGIGKAQEDNAERIRYEKKYADRIANYEDLTKKLEHSITYEELWAELEKEIEQHEEDSSQHRTDLAMYTAEKGGYTMGANMIWEAVPDMNEARRQLAIAKNAVNANAEGVEMLRQNVGELDKLSAAIGGCDALLDQIAKIEQMMAAPPATEPEAPETVEENVQQQVTEEQQQETQGDPPQLMMSKPPKTEADQKENEDALNKENTEGSSGEENKEETVEELKKEEVNKEEPVKEEVKKEEVKKEEPVKEEPKQEEPKQEEVKQEEKQTEGSIIPAGEGANENVKQFRHRIRVNLNAQSGGMDMAKMLQELAGAAAQLGAVPEDPSSLESIKKAVSETRDGYLYILSMAEENAKMTLEQMHAAIKQYDEGKAQLAAAEKGLNEAQAALENIWYELEQLEVEREELVEMRDVLNEEAARLSKEIVAADELHELENDRTSAKLLLTSVKEVNNMVEAGGEIVPSAEKYLADYKAQTQLQHKGWLASCALAIIGGIAGIFAIPAVYEFVRKRSWLIVPAVVSVVLAAAAELAYYAVGLGWWYVGMFAAIIGLIHLVIVAPKEKKPGES